MADREKVINHFHDAIEAIGNNNKWRFVRVDVLEDGIELLKEQEPVEPQKENDGNPGKWASWWYVCGNCGGAIDYRDRFCRYCGRAVKWDG